MTRQEYSVRSMIALLGPALLAACATVPQLGPAPVVAPPESYSSDRVIGSNRGAWPEQSWWLAYRDPQLDSLIAEALAGSPDVRSAAARVRAANAYVEQARAAQLPSVDGRGSVSLGKQSYNNGIPPAFVPQGWNDSGSVSANLGFDLDLWGRNSAAYAAARSDADAARLDFLQAALVLSTNVADAYADLTRLFAERRVQLTVLEVRQQTEQLVRTRVGANLDTQAELRQASSAVPAARADLAATDEQIGLMRNRLAALLGKGPDRGLDIVAPTVSVATRGIPQDVTTDLIGRRPDVAAARARVEAEASRIKVARADFYPAVNLSAVFGFQSFGIGNLVKTGSSYGSVGPAISLPIFRGGELQGKYRGARANYDAAVADYDRVVTDAYRAVADAVVSQRALTTRLAESQQALDESRGAFAIARQRYQAGLSTFLDVLTAQDRTLQAERIVVDLQARAFSLDIALVRALGGGFVAPATNTNQPGKDKNNG